MRRLRLAPLSLALLLTACQLRVAPGPVADPRRSEAPAARVGPAPSPKASKPPAAAPGAIAISRLGTLQAPPGANVRLAGTVKVDAAAMVAAGAGNLLPRAGGQVLLAGGVQLVGNDGATALGKTAGNLIGATGARFDGQGGLRVAEVEGGAFVAAGGGALIGNDGSTLIGNDGSTLIGNDGSTYRLAQASAAEVPAANMLISVVSLRTRAYLPLGTDAGGQPAYAILSDAQGGYQVFLPPGEERNVVVVAQVPGSSAPALVLNALGERDAGAGTAVDVDTRSSSGARFMRQLMIARTGQFFTAASLDALVESYMKDADTPEGARPLVKEMAAYYHALGERLGVGPGEDPAVVTGLARAMSDAALSMVDLRTPQISRDNYPDWPLPPTNSLELLDGFFGDLEARARRYMAEPTQPGGYRPLTPAWLNAINRAAPVGIDGPAPVVIDPLMRPDRVVRTPAELLGFVLDEYLQVPRDGVWAPLAHLFGALDGAAPDDVEAYARNRFEVEKLRRAFKSLGGVVAFEMHPGQVGSGQDPSPDSKGASAAVAAALAFDLEAARARARR